MRRDVLVRAGGFAVVSLAAGVLFIARGADGNPLLVVCGLAALVGFVLIVYGVLRLEVRQRGMTAEQRDAAYAGRLDEAQQRRPAWLDSRAYEVLVAVLMLAWIYFLVVGLVAAAWTQVGITAVLLALSFWTWLRIRRRRRASSDS